MSDGADRLRPLDTHELAWAAGFFDGEGSIGCIPYEGYATLQIAVVQNDRRPLERFLTVVGVGAIYERPPDKHRTNLCHAWQTGKFEETQAVVAMLWPFLSQPKRDQAHRAMTAMRAYFESKDLIGLDPAARQLRMSQAVRRPLTCMHGHPWTPESTAWRNTKDKGRQRTCRICKNIRGRAWSVRQRALQTSR